MCTFLLQSEMKLFGGFDTMTLKQHFGKKIMELEDEKRAVQVNIHISIFVHLSQFLIPFNVHVSLLLCLWMQKERDRLQTEIENLSATSDGQTQKLQDLHSHKLKSLESQVYTCSHLCHAHSELEVPNQQSCSNCTSFTPVHLRFRISRRKKTIRFIL